MLSDLSNENIKGNVSNIQDFVLERFHINRLPDRIEMVRANQAVPGTIGGMRRVTGLNTDAQGNVNYFAGTNQRSHEIRNENRIMKKKYLLIFN